MKDKKTLVFGASVNPERYSNKAIKLLRANHITTKAYGLRKGEIDGVAIDVDLKKYKDIHTVTLYINSKRQEAYYNYIISLQPKRVLFNPGTENPTFQQLLLGNNIVFEEACTLVLLTTGQY